METAQHFSLHVLIIWFSCELGPQIQGIDACSLHAQWASTSAVRTPSITYWQRSQSWIARPHIFE
jgi:hypothetical protein